MEQKRSKTQTSQRTQTQARRTAQKPAEPMSRDELRSKRNLERRKKRRRNKIIGYTVVIILIIAAAIALSLTVFFKIQSINVTGDDIYNAETIVAASGLNVGENMFKSSKKDISNKLETSLPYIESVHVKRSPTGNVTLVITAAKAELAIDCGEGYILLNKNGKVLEDGVVSINEDVATVTASTIVTATPGDIIVFENEQDTQTLKDIKSIIDSKQIEKITDINITQNSSVVLTYDMRITLEVGMMSTLEQKMDFVKATLDKLNSDEPNFEGSIDFTVENKAFVNEKTEQTTTAPTVAAQPEAQGEAA
ncbi:MAG: FtsQ-type POTRA domain-containing protein [Ruminococcus sp.]|nr:FtsQ-type POTRA domain-containing protein [Ruminococcus sp.]